MSDKPKIFITRNIPDQPLARAKELFDVEQWEDDWNIPRDELLARVKGKDGLMTLLTEKVDGELLDAAGSQLKIVANFAVGFDNIDVPACTERGILASNTPEVLSETTADLAFALLISATLILVSCIAAFAATARVARSTKRIGRQSATSTAHAQRWVQEQLHSFLHFDD
jgi:lactate dehydrogenase-like 2-hydroxyacid dehydrogenase